MCALERESGAEQATEDATSDEGCCQPLDFYFNQSWGKVKSKPECLAEVQQHLFSPHSVLSNHEIVEPLLRSIFLKSWKDVLYCRILLHLRAGRGMSLARELRDVIVTLWRIWGQI